MSSNQEKRLTSAGLASASGRDKQRRRFAAVCFRVLLLQLALTSVLALALMFKDFVTAYSAFIGGLLYLLPTGWFSLRVLIKNKAHTPREILANVYMSETGKVLLAVALFSMVFMLIEPLNAAALFVTYILLQVIGWYLQLKLNHRFLKL